MVQSLIPEISGTLLLALVKAYLKDVPNIEVNCLLSPILISSSSGHLMAAKLGIKSNLFWSSYKKDILDALTRSHMAR